MVSKFFTDFIIYSSSGAVYIKSGSGVVYTSGSYQTLKNTLTGSLSGTVYDGLLTTIEGYSSGILQSQICLTGSLTLSGSNILGKSITVTNISGSLISGSTIYGSYISGSNISGSTITGSNIYSNYISGSTITGSNIVSNYISGSSISGSSSIGTCGKLTLITISGSTPHNLGATATYVNLTATGSPGVNYLGALTWYPSGSTGIWIVQTGSGGVPIVVNWWART